MENRLKTVDNQVISALRISILQFFVCNTFLLQVLYLHGLHGAYPVVA